MILCVKHSPVLSFTIVNLSNCHVKSNILFIMLIIRFMIELTKKQRKIEFFYDSKKCNVIRLKGLTTR